MDKLTVVITGASAGIGRATALEFARRGARVALLARGRAGLEAAAREVEAAGGEALVLPTDVADAGQVEAAAEITERVFGPIDVWVNNAMVSVFAPVHETRADEYARVTQVTYLGYVHGTLAAYRRMRLRDRGTIVQVGSALAYRSIPLQSAYCAAKHAIAGFTESLRSELIHDGSNVHVTMVQLPACNTPQFDWVRSRLDHRAQPVPPIYQPEVAARAIVWASSRRRRELYVGWPTVKAIVGDRIWPAALDWYLAKVGYGGQQTDAREHPDRPDNLFTPMPELARTHGRFNERAWGWSFQTWLATRPRWLLAVAAAGVAGAIGAAWQARTPASLAEPRRRRQPERPASPPVPLPTS